MKSSRSRFALLAVAGIMVFALAQTPAQAQFRRAMPPRPMPAAPVFPRANRVPIVVPPISSCTNRYVLPGLTLNQIATLDVLTMNGIPPWMYWYYNPYRFVTPIYPNIYPLPYTTFTTPISVPGLPYNPYNFYNPYFAAFGLFP